MRNTITRKVVSLKKVRKASTKQYDILYCWSDGVLNEEVQRMQMAESPRTTLVHSHRHGELCAGKHHVVLEVTPNG